LYLAWEELRNLLLAPVAETLTLGEMASSSAGRGKRMDASLTQCFSTAGYVQQTPQFQSRSMYNCSTCYQSRRHLSTLLGMQFSLYKVNFDRVHSGKDFNQRDEETSECDEKADSNCSKWRQGNRVTVSREDYNLRESDQRTTNHYDRKQGSTRKYYGKETS
jgi:hypothetical protein